MAKARVVASRKFGLVFVTSMLCLQLCTSLQNDTSIYTVQVFRRISFDIYVLSSDLDSHENCDSTLNRTYLVNERECVSDQELYSGCSFGIIPTIMQSIIPIADVKSIQGSTITVLLTDFSTNESTFIFNETKQLVNSSFCNISSLDVYRGREQAIEISHEGFSLSDSGTIEIHKDQLAYAVKDYGGELYRMNLSCSGGGLPESGYLFFKVTSIGGTNITNAKFNNTVPGTLIDTYESNITTERSDSITFSINIHVTTSAAVPATDDSTTETFKVGSVLFYIVVGVAGGIIVITIGFIIVCVLIGFSVRRKRKSYTLTIASTLQPHNGTQTQGPEPSPYENPWPNSAYLASNSGHVYPHTRDTNSDSNNIVGHDRYQVQYFSTTVVEHPSALPQKELRTENNALEMWYNDEKKQLALCASIQSPDSKIENSKEDLELSQVYDTVSSKPPKEGVAEGLVYSQLSRPARHGKQSLPAYLGAPEYSALNVSKSSPRTKIGESMPVYEAPDVTTKVQRSEAMMSSSHKVSSWSCPPLPLFIVETRNTDHEHTHAILEQDQLEPSTCTQAKTTESEHTYSILEQDHVERLLPNENTTKEAEMEHAYAILEQEQLLSHSNQTEPECRILEEKEPKSWMFNSLQSLKSDRDRKHSASRDVHFELVQIYNTVSPKPSETRATEKQLSHQACSKKQSLPSYLGALPTDYSALEVRSAPDVKKKKQKRKKKWSEDQSSGVPIMAAASHKISTTSCPPLSLFTESVDTRNRNTMNGQHSLISTSSRRRKQSVTEHTQHLASLVDNTFPDDEPTSLSLAPKKINSESKTIENEG